MGIYLYESRLRPNSTPRLSIYLQKGIPVIRYAADYLHVSLFAPVVPLGGIRRWRSENSREYLWLGDLQYRKLIELVAYSSGLTDQIRLAAETSSRDAPNEPTFQDE